MDCVSYELTLSSARLQEVNETNGTRFFFSSLRVIETICCDAWQQWNVKLSIGILDDSTIRQFDEVGAKKRDNCIFLLALFASIPIQSYNLFFPFFNIFSNLSSFNASPLESDAVFDFSLLFRPQTRFSFMKIIPSPIRVLVCVRYIRMPFSNVVCEGLQSPTDDHYYCCCCCWIVTILVWCTECGSTICMDATNYHYYYHFCQFNDQ